MTPYQVKRAILFAAIQGKLTKQDLSEGTGEQFLKSNEEKRKECLQQGLIRTQKPCKTFCEEDYLFDVPANWAWERFGNLVFNFDSRRKPVTKENRKTTKGLYDYYGATGAIDKVDDYIFDGEYLMIGEDGGNFFVERDNSFIASGQFWANNHVHVVKPILCSIWYLKHCLDAYSLPNMGLINGIAVPKLNQENMNSIMIPVPPLAEQKRIVAKIEELLPYLDRYEKAWNRLEDFNRRFPADMQKSILQMAIQGKLVEQRPEEGTGEELYRQIQAEKQALIKAGKIKKEKPLPEIAEDEVPFEIPEGWKWVRVGEIFAHNTGKAMNSSAKQTAKKGSVRKFITTSNLYWNTFDLLSVKEMFFSDDELARCTATKNDLLMCEGGAYFGRTAIWSYDYDVCFQNHIHRLRPYCEVCQKFYYYIFFFYKNMNMMKAKGTAMPGLSSVVLHEMVVPLPPLAEQKRIVARLEEILPLCERLK
ncbi:MAG: restriction endonuclease subunit S [Candidatus Ventricola sp.]